MCPIGCFRKPGATAGLNHDFKDLRIKEEKDLLIVVRWWIIIVIMEMEIWIMILKL